MRARRLLPLIAVVALVAGIAVLKFSQIRLLMRYGAAARASGPPPESVATTIAKEERWATTLKAVGSVATVEGVTLSNEVSGVVTAIPAISGARVKLGDPIVELDANVERAQLAAALARRDLAATTLERTRKLVRTGALAKTQLDADATAYEVASADVSSLVAQIAKKTIRAPFAGKLGIVLVTKGQFLSSGTKLAVLEATDAHYVDFTLPEQQVGLVAPGDTVGLRVVGVQGAIGGAIETIDPHVDPVARALKLRARASDAGKGLRPGMFVDVSVTLPGERRVVVVPATAIVHAAYGDSLFVVEQGKGPKGEPELLARQRFVRVGELRGDFVAIDQGLDGGARVVSAGAFKLRNGARVAIDDQPTLHPELAPHPENR